jgi:hypothetical protein
MSLEVWNDPLMSLAEIKEKVVALDPKDQIQLAAFLAALRMKQAGEWETGPISDSSDKTGWISLEEAQKRLLKRG